MNLTVGKARFVVPTQLSKEWCIVDFCLRAFTSMESAPRSAITAQ